MSRGLNISQGRILKELLSNSKAVISCKVKKNGQIVPVLK